MTLAFTKMRNAAAALAILGSLAFGGSQAFATSSGGNVATKAACGACKKECPGFGGYYRAPGYCACCG